MVRAIAFSLLVALSSVGAPAGIAEAQVRGQARAPEPRQRPVTFTATTSATSGVLVLPVGSAEDLALRAPTEHRETIARAAEAGRFNYGARSTLALRGIGGWDQILLLGLGEAPSASTYQYAGAVAGRALLNEPGALTVMANGLPAAAVAELATGMGMGEYRSDLYRTRNRTEPTLARTTIVTDAAAEAGALYGNRGRALIEAMAWTRDISNEPANVVYPEEFVRRTRAAFAGVPGVTIQVLDVPAMERLGMGAILGVGQGSARPPRMLIVRYRGRGAPTGGPIVLVGKGITFDSGGITIKGGAGMGNMRMDMSGAASVTGAVLALARSRAPVDVVAIAALAENMPDGAAVRPGDVLTAMNGMTIEVDSTDAEGRLVIADAVVWAQRNLNPAVIIDVATLTGAVRTALGDDYAGLFSRHDDLIARLSAAGDAIGERVWQLPLHESYGTDISSTYADLRNTGAEGAPGAGVGAYFIGEFISRDIPWAHIDIANVAWSGAQDWKPAGSTGYGVRMLERFVLDWRPAP